ncbi:uncharacterized protein WM277_011185 isoform 1-T2 [Molossus nigricans]
MAPRMAVSGAPGKESFVCEVRMSFECSNVMAMRSWSLSSAVGKMTRAPVVSRTLRICPPLPMRNLWYSGLVRQAMLAGIDDVATPNCFSSFASVSLQSSQLFATYFPSVLYYNTVPTGWWIFNHLLTGLKQ